MTRTSMNTSTVTAPRTSRTSVTLVLLLLLALSVANLNAESVPAPRRLRTTSSSNLTVETFLHKLSPKEMEEQKKKKDKEDTEQDDFKDIEQPDDEPSNTAQDSGKDSSSSSGNDSSTTNKDNNQDETPDDEKDIFTTDETDKAKDNNQNDTNDPPQDNTEESNNTGDNSSASSKQAACQAAKDGTLYTTDESIQVSYDFEIETTTQDPMDIARTIQDKLFRHLTQTLVLDKCPQEDDATRKQRLLQDTAVDSIRSVRPGTLLLLDQACQASSASEDCALVRASTKVYLDESVQLSKDEKDTLQEDLLATIYQDLPAILSGDDSGLSATVTGDRSSSAVNGAQQPSDDNSKNGMGGVGIFFVTALLVAVVVAAAMLIVMQKKKRDHDSDTLFATKSAVSMSTSSPTTKSLSPWKPAFSWRKKNSDRERLDDSMEFNTNNDDDRSVPTRFSMPRIIASNTMETARTSTSPHDSFEDAVAMGSEVILADLQEISSNPSRTRGWKTTIEYSVEAADSSADAIQFPASLQTEDDISHSQVPYHIERAYRVSDTVQL